MAGAAKAGAHLEIEKAKCAKASATKHPEPRPQTTAAPVAAASPADVRVWETQSKVLPSGVLGTKISKLDETTSMFSQAVLVEHDEAFTLKPLILTEGPFAGRRILMLVKNVTFLDLPAEVRNQIWDLVLEKNKTFNICVRNRGARFYTNGPPQSRRLMTVALARTNKQVSAEVLAIVLGSNTFDFMTLAHFAEFVRRLGVSRSHLRYVSVSVPMPFRVQSRGAADPWHCLQDMTNIQSLIVNHENVLLHAVETGGRMKLRDLFHRLKPFLYAWHEARKKKSDGFCGVRELVRFVGDDRVRIEWPGRTQLERVTEKWREMVAQEFGPAE